MAAADYHDLVQQFYIGYYGRPADPEGLDFWASQVDAAGGDFTAVRDAFATSDEATDFVFTNPATGEDYTDEELVINIYENLFGRDPSVDDQEGLNFYVDGLASGEFAAQDVVKRVADGAQNEDATTLANKVEVAQYFTDNLGDKAYTADGIVDARALLDGVDETDDSVSAGETAADEMIADLEEGDSEAYSLTVGQDNETGTDDDDLFIANAGANDSGYIANALNTGDQLDGGAGYDTLDASVYADYTLDGSETAVRPITENIENVEINALNSESYDEQGLALATVYLDAADMEDITDIGSYDSNANLVVRDLTTRTSDGVARNTEAITIHMDHTANENHIGEASDLEVYFDNNYLLAGESSEYTLELRTVNAYTLAEDGEPLTGFEQISFDVGDQDVDVDISDAETYSDVVEAINTALEDQGITDVEAQELPERTVIFSDDLGGYRQGDVAGQYNPVRVVSTNEKLEQGNIKIDSDVEDYDGLNTWIEGSTEEDLPVTSNIELEKVGRAGDGGDLIVGGKSTSEHASGIQVFNVAVRGDEDKPSNLGTLGTTNGDLETVNISTHENYVEGETFASLTIRDGFGDDQAGVELVDASGFLGDLTLGSGNPIQNLNTLDATGGGDVTFYGDNDDGGASITTGSGDDFIDAGDGGDTLTGNDGADEFFYDAASGDSYVVDGDLTNMDTITDLDLTEAEGDQIGIANSSDLEMNLLGSVGANLSESSIQTDLDSAFTGDATTGILDAQIITDDGSDDDLSGKAFLVVDTNQDGSITDQDLTIEVTGYEGTLSADSFTQVGGVVVVPNTDPVAENDADAFTVQQGDSVTINTADLLANDSDADGDPLTITSVNDLGTDDGEAVLSADGETITFTAAAEYDGPASFAYSVSDGEGGTDTAEVTGAVTVGGGGGLTEVDITDGSTVDAAGGDFQFNTPLGDTDIFAANIANFDAGDVINIDDEYLPADNMLFDTTGTDEINFAFGDLTDFTPSFTLNLTDVDSALVTDVEAAADTVEIIGVLEEAWGQDFIV